MFYGSAVPISAAQHHDWSVETGTDYLFSKNANSVPLTAVEFPRAASEYVIVFSGAEEAVMPAVILGLRGNENLYLAGSSVWSADYIPAFVRRYPFIFSSSDEGKTLTLCIDEGFAGLNREHRGERLFDEAGKPTRFVENVLAFLRDYQAQAQRTRAFCSKLVELDLLHPMRAQVTLDAGGQVSLTGFMAVDRDRLKALAPEVLANLVKSEHMELIYLHLQSIRNFTELKNRATAATPAESGKASSNRHSVRTTFDASSGHAMYDADFIFGECGFDWIPPWIDRNLLFNASYDLGTGEIKLYFLDAAKSTIFKVSGKTITKQYDALRFRAPPARLSEFLGAEFDYSDLLLDTVEDDVYYVLMEDTSQPQYLKFFRALCEKFDISEERLIAVVNKINERQVKTLHECYGRKAVSGVKVPFLGRNCKLYARPFLTGNSYELSRGALKFLTRFHGCSEAQLQPRIRYLWVASELLSDRVVVTTQHHALVHET
jgi:hypothetical protein